MTEQIPQSGSESAEDVNFHKLAKERAELRRQINETGPEMADILAQSLDELNQKAQEFSRLRQANPAEAKARLKTEKKSYEADPRVDEISISVEVGSAYILLDESHDKLAEVRDFEIRRLREGVSNPTARGLNETILPRVRNKKENLQKAIAKIKESNPNEYRAFELVSYLKGLHREGHIAPVASVEKYLDEIGVRMISGKPMFLHGPTGTGKTSLARYAAEHFTGQKAEMVYCNPQTREANIWGKQGIRPAEGEAGERGAIQTVDIYGPLARAMAEGRVVIFDEFTALPREQMVFIKGIFNAKPGDTVNIMGNGVVTIKPGFQMIFTANLKSEKNPERQELPPEIAREFEQNNLEIGYTPPAEAYDIMLVRMMNADGSIDISAHDLNDTLSRFAKALAEIQIAYTDRASTDTARLTGTLDPSGKAPGLKKLVMTQGSVEAILEGWRIQRQTDPDKMSFIEFLDQRLKTALTFKEYSEPDRTLAAKILASAGFLRTLTPSDLGFSSDIFNFDAANKLRGDKKAIVELAEKSAEERNWRLLELADLDPFGRRQAEAASVAQSFLPPEAQAPEVTGPVPEIKAIKTRFGGYLKKSYKESWGGSDPVVAKAGEKPEIRKPKDIIWSNTTEVDANKFGEFTMNPDTIGIDWERVPPEKIKVFDFTNFVGKKRWELAKYIATEWPDRDKYLIPGIEYWKYVFENPAKTPAALKDGNYHYFFGSMFRNSDGNWDVPNVGWGGTEFGRYGRWLDDDWHSDYRVVLLEK